MRPIIFLFALFTSTASAQTLADLAWLKGCWRTQGEGPVITEVWLQPPMPAMLGYSFTVAEGATQGWEQTRIEMIDGWPHFVAMPNGGAPVRFRMLDTRNIIHTGDDPDGFVAFENPAHDYPKRVTYVRFGDRLTAQISGANGADSATFRYRRIPCAPGLRP